MPVRESLGWRGTPVVDEDNVVEMWMKSSCKRLVEVTASRGALGKWPKLGGMGMKSTGLG